MTLGEFTICVLTAALVIVPWLLVIRYAQREQRLLRAIRRHRDESKNGRRSRLDYELYGHLEGSK